MLQQIKTHPKRILMTLDAVGGVWQYALGLARQLFLHGDTVVLAGVGPQPSAVQKEEAASIATLVWLKTPPEWMARDETELHGFPDEIARLVREYAIDLVHLNDPGQVVGLEIPCPVIAISHSCIATWFRAVRDALPPPEWRWQIERTRAGLEQVDLLATPSRSHAAALNACYGMAAGHLVVHNAATPVVGAGRRENFVFAAGRWWDGGKNGKVLDDAATAWPVLAAGPTNGPNGDVFSFGNATGLGSLPYDETRRLMTRCGIFVSPSLYEPFGLAALEAATAGTPLVLADIPSYRELWSEAAAFFSPRDPDALSQTINRLAQDAQLRRWLGAAAQRRSRAFSFERQAAAIRTAYGQAAHVHGRRC